MLGHEVQAVRRGSDEFVIHFVVTFFVPFLVCFPRAPVAVAVHVVVDRRPWLEVVVGGHVSDAVFEAYPQQQIEFWLDYVGRYLEPVELVSFHVVVAHHSQPEGERTRSAA